MIPALLTGVQMLAGRSRVDSSGRQRLVNPWLIGVTPSGAAIGLLSGMVGVGGGIFLSPLLHVTRWASAYKIAVACSAFILFNSIVGLGGQLMKRTASEPAQQWAGEQLINAWPLFLVLYVAARLMLKWYGITFGH